MNPNPFLAFILSNIPQSWECFSQYNISQHIYSLFLISTNRFSDLNISQMNTTLLLIY